MLYLFVIDIGSGSDLMCALTAGFMSGTVCVPAPVRKLGKDASNKKKQRERETVCLSWGSDYRPSFQDRL